MQHKTKELVDSISIFIINWLKRRDSFECRSFYGESFSLALLQRVDKLNTEVKNTLMSSYKGLNKLDSQFHWEFNNYAFLDYYKISNDESVKKFLDPLKFKNTPCTNWTLLRSSARLMAGIDIELGIKEAKMKIKKFQLSSGLVLDDPGVKSFQYHCFSIGMIGEIYEQTEDEYFKKSFLKGIEFIRHFILSNGEALYIGRGQNQSFGYGALIYILSLAYKFTNDKTLLGDIDKVTDFLIQHQREDGSFPLVMNGVEKSIPKVIDIQNEEFVGWYPYNNYFDYLPFMGFFIAKAHKILKGLNIEDVQYKKQQKYRDSNFIKVVKPNYEAVISKCGGYWTNDMPIPYVISNGKNLTPCYGGEQFQTSLYSLEGIALPYCDKLKKSIRWRSISFFNDDILWIISPLGIMKREFIFEEDYIDIRTEIYSFFNCKHIYLLLNNNKEVYINGDSFDFDGYEYSASGRLKKLIDRSRVSNIRLKIES